VSLISVVIADETVKDDTLDGHQNSEEAKKEGTEPTQWPVKESSKSTAQASSSSEKRNKRFLTIIYLFCQITQIPIIFLIQSNLQFRPPVVGDHLTSATSFPKYQTFPSQITINISCKRSPLLSDCDHF